MSRQYECDYYDAQIIVSESIEEIIVSVKWLLLTCVEKIHNGGHGDETDEGEGFLLLHHKASSAHSVQLCSLKFSLFSSARLFRL